MFSLAGSIPTSWMPRVSRSLMMTAGTRTREAHPATMSDVMPSSASGRQSCATSKLWAMLGSSR